MDLPAASVIVVSRHRTAGLLRCLTGLSQQDHPHFEVIVVADPEAVMAVPARIKKGRTCSYFHSAETQGVAGCTGTRACRTSQSGVKCSGAMSWYKAWRSSCRAPLGFSAAFSAAFILTLSEG